MRWGLAVFMASVSVAAQQSPASEPLPRGVDISARDGDRIVIEDDAYIEVVRKRQATVRAIFDQEERTLIVLLDFSMPGEFPDGSVDWVFNFYQVEGTWPLGPRWEALTTVFQFETQRQQPRGLAFETPLGLVHLVSGGPHVSRPDPRASAVLSYTGSSSGRRFGPSSFAEAEADQLRSAARNKASTDTTFSLASPRNATAKTHDKATVPPGQDISANTGDRVMVDDEARIQIVRRRQATIRTIFRHEQRLLMLLADYAKPGELPDGTVDLAINFYELEGWPLAPRWEGLTIMFEHEGDPQFSSGYVLGTPLGLVHLSPSTPPSRKPEPTASAVLWFGGSSTRLQPGMSFAEAETLQISEAARQAATR